MAVGDAVAARAVACDVATEGDPPRVAGPERTIGGSDRPYESTHACLAILAVGIDWATGMDLAASGPRFRRGANRRPDKGVTRLAKHG